jgi:hypothetical protein
MLPQPQGSKVRAAIFARLKADGVAIGTPQPGESNYD